MGFANRNLCQINVNTNHLDYHDYIIEYSKQALFSKRIRNQM